MSSTVHHSFQYLTASWLYVHDVVHFHGCTCCNHCVSSMAYRFPISYLDTFSIAGSWTGGLKIVFPMFRDLQIVPGVPRYKFFPLECPIMPSSVLCVLRSTLRRHTIWPSSPHLCWLYLVTLFWSPTNIFRSLMEILTVLAWWTIRIKSY